MIEYLLVPAAYLVGASSSAILIARVKHLEDPRDVGSGNPGATNILRYGGKTAAALTLLGDVVKGAIPVVITRSITGDSVVLALVGLAAFLGHLYPVFFRFRGGKGVATAFGVWLGLSPWVALALLLTWLLIAALFRYSSLAALVASFAAPAYVWWVLYGQLPYLVASIAMSVLLCWRHRANIRNLFAGKEDKIGHMDG
jgi:glycerol-3-phosphate acyltransferase PlsY